MGAMGIFEHGYLLCYYMYTGSNACDLLNKGVASCNEKKDVC